MRFCPFCSAENADDLAVCQACGRRLPPLPPRRGTTRNAPPTGIQLPNRPAGSATAPRPPAAPPAVPVPMPRDRQRSHDSAEATTVEPDPVESTIVDSAARHVDGRARRRRRPAAAARAEATARRPARRPTHRRARAGRRPDPASIRAVRQMRQLRDSAPALPPPAAPIERGQSPPARERAQARTAAAQRREPRPTIRHPRQIGAVAPNSKQPLSPTVADAPAFAVATAAVADSVSLPRRPPTGPNNTALGMRPHPPSQPPPFKRAPTVPPPIPAPVRSQASPFGGDTFVTDNDFSRPKIQALRPRDADRAAADADPHRGDGRSPVHAGAGARGSGDPRARPRQGRALRVHLRACALAAPRCDQAARLEIRQDTDALDQVLGALGAAARYGARRGPRVLRRELRDLRRAGADQQPPEGGRRGRGPQGRGELEVRRRRARAQREADRGRAHGRRSAERARRISRDSAGACATSAKSSSVG